MTQDFAARLRRELKDRLKAVDIHADVLTEPVPSTKLYRVKVLAAKFTKLKYTERQNLVWRIVEKVLGPEDQLRISMIFTLTPDEEAGK
jgi:hypothetical protein